MTAAMLGIYVLAAFPVMVWMMLAGDHRPPRWAVVLAWIGCIAMGIRGTAALLGAP